MHGKVPCLRSRCWRGEFGATPQYWMLYQRMIDLIHQLHYSVNINDFWLCLHSWEERLKLSAVIKRNYFDMDYIIPCSFVQLTRHIQVLKKKLRRKVYLCAEMNMDFANQSMVQENRHSCEVQKQLEESRTL